MRQGESVRVGRGFVRSISVNVMRLKMVCGESGGIFLVKEQV